MNKKVNIEAEGGELIIKNEAGDMAIIPAKYRHEVNDMIKDNCFGCVDNLVSTLPIMNDYAEDGTLISADGPKKSKVYVLAERPPLKNYFRDFEPHQRDSHEYSSYITDEVDNILGFQRANILQNRRRLIHQLRSENLEYQEAVKNNDTQRKTEILNEVDPDYENRLAQWQTKYDELINNPETLTKFNEIKLGQHRENLQYDDTFVSEANRFKERLKSGEDVQIVPFYWDENIVRNVYKSIQPGDKFTIFGHAGGTFGGIDVEKLAQWASEDIVNKKDVECLLGSCGSGQTAQKFANISGIPSYGYNKSWYGPNGPGKDVVSLLYGYDYNTDELGNESFFYTDPSVRSEKKLPINYRDKLKINRINPIIETQIK